MLPLLFDSKQYEQTLRPGLCLSDSRMTVAHNFTVGISLLDPHCLLWVQYCFLPVQLHCHWLDLWGYVPLCYHQFSVVVVGASLSSYVVHEFPWQYFLEYHFLVIQAIIHGTDLSNILIFVRFGIALAVNQPLCSLKHSFCYIQFLSFQVIFKLQGLCHIQM